MHIIQAFGIFLGQPEMNLKQKGWMDIVMNYDLGITHHSKKFNLVVDAIGHWKESVLIEKGAEWLFASQCVVCYLK